MKAKTLEYAFALALTLGVVCAFAAPPAKVAIESVPSGATVTVAGQSCTTPCQLEVPRGLQQFTAEKEDFKTETKSEKVVRAGQVIKLELKYAIPYYKAGKGLTDPRNKKKYKTRILLSKDGNSQQEWMAENLNIVTKTSKCPDGDKQNCAKQGRLYSWADAMYLDPEMNTRDDAAQFVDSYRQGICPDGWRLPTWSDMGWALALYWTHDWRPNGQKDLGFDNDAFWGGDAEDHVTFSSNQFDRNRFRTERGTLYFEGERQHNKIAMHFVRCVQKVKVNGQVCDMENGGKSFGSYVCENGEWRPFTEVEKELGGAICNGEIEGKLMGKYVCEKKGWRLLTQLETEVGAPCIDNMEGKIKGRYICENKQWRAATSDELYKADTDGEICVGGKVIKGKNNSNWTYKCGKNGWVRYKVKMPDGKNWMARNLNSEKAGGECYDHDERMCVKYGRLYSWKEAIEACPKGWHLPSRDEWKNLFLATAVATGEETKEEAAKKAIRQLKSASGWYKNGTDDYGFSVLPAGYLTVWFQEEGLETRFWTSEEKDGYPFFFEFDNSEGDESVNIRWGRQSSDAKGANSVRCIQDDGYQASDETPSDLSDASSNDVQPKETAVAAAGNATDAAVRDALPKEDKSQAKKKTNFLPYKIGAMVLGAAFVGLGAYMNSLSDDYYSEYQGLKHPTPEDTDAAWDNVEGANTRRNLCYGLGSALLAGGLVLAVAF